MNFSFNTLKDIPRDKFDIDENTHLKKLLDFFEDQVQNFANNQDFSKSDLHEETLNEELVKYLNAECVIESLPIHFHSEPRSDINSISQGKQPAVDLGIILARRNTDKKSIFDIEAKRLRKPPSRSKQYVEGKTGGIERFKRGLHGKNLKKSAVIGYVEEGSFDFWFSKINEWIIDLAKSNSDTTITWKRSETLEKRYFNQTNARCRSENIRTGNNIILQHFWVKINPN